MMWREWHGWKWGGEAQRSSVCVWGCGRCSFSCEKGYSCSVPLKKLFMLYSNAEPTGSKRGQGLPVLLAQSSNMGANLFLTELLCLYSILLQKVSYNDLSTTADGTGCEKIQIMCHFSRTKLTICGQTNKKELGMSCRRLYKLFVEILNLEMTNLLFPFSFKTHFTVSFPC